MNLVKIVKNKSEAALREVLVEWLHCLPRGYLLTKREKDLLKEYLFIYIKLLSEVQPVWKKPSNTLSALIWKQVFSVESLREISFQIKLSEFAIRVNKSSLLKKGIIVKDKDVYKISPDFIPIFDKTGDLVVKTIIRINS